MICCAGTSRRTFIPTLQSPTAVVVRAAGKAAFPTIWRRSLPAKGSPPLQFRRSPLNCSPTHFSLLLPGLELFSSRKRSSSQRLAWQVRHPTLNTQKTLIIFLFYHTDTFFDRHFDPTATTNNFTHGGVKHCSIWGHRQLRYNTSAADHPATNAAAADSRCQDSDLCQSRA